jgi:hypothetical protein
MPNESDLKHVQMLIDQLASRAATLLNHHASMSECRGLLGDLVALREQVRLLVEDDHDDCA